MTNLERYQSMTAEEFGPMFFESICSRLPCTDDGICDDCIINHLNAEYKEATHEP